MSPVVLIILLGICVVIVFILSEQQTGSFPTILPSDEDIFMEEEELEDEELEDSEAEKEEHFNLSDDEKLE